MNRAVKLGAMAFVLIAVTVLLYTAASDSIFFVAQRLTPDNAVYDMENGYEFYFYKDGTAVKVVTIFHNVEQGDGNLAPIIFQVLPKDRYEVDSLHLEFKMLQPTSALILENPEGGTSIPFIYTRSDYDSSVVLDFPNLASQGSETVTLNFWLDLLEIEPATPDKLILDITFTMHEESILKIVRYNANIAIQLDVPSTSP
jgi:hypothetical protein